jgi:hypothetical protein
VIIVVEGAVGAGKTYWVVSEIARHLRSGGIVCTNLDLHLRALRELTGRRLSSGQFLLVSADQSPFDIPRGDFRGGGKRRVMVVLDEALNWFPSSRDASDKGADWQTWLRQSDKLGQDVYFVAQRFDRAAKWLRELAQICVSVRNWGQVRLLGLPVGRFLGLRRISTWARYDLALRQVLGWGVYTLHPGVWRCYETAKLYGFPASSNAYDATTGCWPSVRFPRLGLLILWLFALLGFVRLLLVLLFK